MKLKQAWGLETYIYPDGTGGTRLWWERPPLAYRLRRWRYMARFPKQGAS